jgi:small subunit ribosomal protein S6
MRRYELMLILRPDVADDRTKAIFERTARSITEQGGTILKDVAWGRRRMAYEIDGVRDGVYQIIVFEAPASAVAEVERVLLITEEVLRHLVIRDERKGAAALRDDVIDGIAAAEPYAQRAPDRRVGAGAIDDILRLDDMALFARKIRRGDAHDIVALLQPFKTPAKAKIDAIEAPRRHAKDRIGPDLVAALRAFRAHGGGA